MYETKNASLGCAASASNRQAETCASDGHLAVLNHRLATLVNEVCVLRNRLTSLTSSIYGDGPANPKTADMPRPVPNGRLESLRADLDEMEHLIADCHTLSDALQALS